MVDSMNPSLLFFFNFGSTGAGALSLEPCPRPFALKKIIRFYDYAQVGLDCNPIYASCIAGMTSIHHTQPLVLIGSP
jgi:hypothetical protein